MKTFFSTAAALAFAALPVFAQELAEPAGPVALTVTGTAAVTNSDAGAVFDLEMLEALPQHKIVSDTPWYDTETTFTGPLISDIVEMTGAEGETVRVIALNDYSAEIPMSDVTDYPVILATRINGERLSVRDKGPLFVVYPFDAFPDLYNEMIFGRSVWQVAGIEVK